RVNQPNYTFDPFYYAFKELGIQTPKGWEITGDLRTGYVNYDYSNSPYNFNPDINKGHKDSKGYYFIPKVSIISPKYKGFYGKITGAGVTDFGLNDSAYETRTFALGTEGGSGYGHGYAILQEAYLSYAQDGQKFLIGSEELSTPMIDSDDWYLLANTFQLAYYANRTFENILFAGGYFYKMAGVWDSGADGTTYNSMADASFVDARDKANASDGGVYAGVFQYSDETHNLQVWNYYAPDLYNTLFAQYDYTQKVDGFSYDAGAQFINFKEVGALADNDYTHIDYSIFSLRFDGKFENGFDISTGASFFTDGEGVGATLGAWGGYPYFANGMIFHFFEAGSLQNANSYKVQLGYDLGEMGIKNLWAGVRLTHFDLDPNYSKTATGLPQDEMSLIGLRLSYQDKSGLYFTGSYEYVDLDNEPSISALRLIGGYKF
ncbi:MAG: hypothetical protein U9Q90_04240, partial [Campylobacterota bacterium]|nr:hypothetical protein [Campylobacterota bacterium]